MIPRRDFLKRVAALGASAAVPGAMLGACGGDDDGSRAGTRESRRMHFDLSAAPIEAPRLFAALSANHRQLLVAHDSASRARHRALDPALEAVPDAQLTHYLEHVDLPAAALQGLQVTGRHPQDGRPLLAAAVVHVPRSARHVQRADVARTATPAADGLSDYATPWDTAVYLVFHHPEVMNLNPALGAEILERSGMAGYGFRAKSTALCDGSGATSSSYTARNLFLGQNPDSAAKSLSCAYAQPVGVLYDPVGPATGGRHFYVEPTPSGFHLRSVVLDSSTAWSSGSKLSWGAFTSALDSLAVLPSGYVIGVNRQTHKMESLLLTETPVDQDDESQAVSFATQQCGLGTRAGLLNTPVAVASCGGAVLVLEQGNARVQALDAHANPVLLFAQGTSNVMALQAESDKVSYLDLAVEGQGYIYVLSYLGEGTSASQYRLDLYTPEGVFLCRTVGVAAARLAVDLFRNVYTLNYETLADAPLPEPSLSQWLPVTSGACPAPPPASAAHAQNLKPGGVVVDGSSGRRCGASD